MTAHLRDADCLATLDPDTLSCAECGVDHSGAPCPWCGAVAFHERGCLAPDNEADPIPASLERWPYPVTTREVGHCWLQDAIDHYLCRQATRALDAIGSREGVRVPGQRYLDYMDAIALCQRLAAGLRAAA